MKKIRLNESMQQTLINKFTEFIRNTRNTSNTIRWTGTLSGLLQETFPSEKPVIRISETAYLKMMLYVRDTGTEIAWHGTVTKEIIENRPVYNIHDVFLYPQKITAATVSTQQDEYNEWITALDDETFNNMRLQGHSHVNFASSPSATDKEYYSDILQTLQETDFYIFMILNKTGDTFFQIYDLDNNIIYEPQDIEVHVCTKHIENLRLDIEQEKQQYCKPFTIPSICATEDDKSIFDYEQYMTRYQNYHRPYMPDEEEAKKEKDKKKSDKNKKGAKK